MSLLTGFLLDSLLPRSVMQQDVFLANRTNGVPGSGTELDPYSAGGAATNADPPFDQIMRSLPENTTVRLMPGTYYTKGYDQALKNWRPKSGMRIVGSSVTNTFLKLANSPENNQLTSLIGCDQHSPTHFLEGLEVQDLTLDATMNASGNISSCGITVNGRNIYIHDVLVKGFEKRGGPDCHGISVAAAYHVPNTYTLIPENCVLDRCRVESPVGSGGAVGIRMTSDTDLIYHRFCVVRNCYVSLLGNGAEYAGMMVGGGIGTIIEHNRITNCLWGVGFTAHAVAGSLNSTHDCTVRHNYFLDTPAGMYFALLTNDKDCDRLLFLNNVVEWPAGTTAPGGLLIVGNAEVRDLVVRNNLFRRANSTITGQEMGMYLSHFERAIVEDNIVAVNDPAQGVRHDGGGTLKAFNNLNEAGTLLRAYNTFTQKFASELADEVENVYLAL